MNSPKLSHCHSTEKKLIPLATERDLMSRNRHLPRPESFRWLICNANRSLTGELHHRL